MRNLFLVLILLFYSDKLSALPELFESGEGISIIKAENCSPIPGLLFKIQPAQKNRFIAAALAITLGMVGAHRIYLGTKPLVPVIYIITLGGGLGLLPLMDTIMILTTKDLAEFENNPKVFMWMK